MHPAWNSWLAVKGFFIKKSRGYSDGMENCMLAVTISGYPASGGPRKIK